MSVSNFELDITSRVTAGDQDGDGPSGLVWQPTLTLWQRGEAAAILSDQPAAHSDAPVVRCAPEGPDHAASPAVTGLTATPDRRTQAAAPTIASGQIKNALRQIWRGDSSLTQTFGGYVLFHLIGAAILSSSPWEEWAGFGYLFVGAFAALAALHFLGGLVFLRAVWRVTLRDSIAGGSALCCGLARGASLLMLIAGVHLAILTCAPRLVELDNIAAGIIPTGKYQLKLVRGGTELAVDGAIGIGLSKNVRRVLDRNPLVQSLQLNSNGGSAREARKLRDLIAARQLSTTTAQGCYGECTLAYVAGEPRRIGEQAALRFYRSTQKGMPDWARWRDYELDRRDWFARGVPIVFADQALSVADASGWQPSLSELIAANFVSPSPTAVQPQVEDKAPDTLAMLEHELRRAPFFTLLKEQEPASYRTLVGEIYAGLQSSGNSENFHLRIHPMAKAVYYGRLSHAEDTLLLDYAEMVLEQISLLYSESAQICNRYFGMDLSGAALDTAKYFPEEMLARETGLMVEVLRSSAARQYRPPARQAIAARWNMVLALIGKRYGAKAVLFFEPHQANRDAGLTCHVLYEFYKAVTRLPAHEAGPLLRYHFAQLQARSMPPTAPMTVAKQVTSVSLPAATGRSAH